MKVADTRRTLSSYSRHAFRLAPPQPPSIHPKSSTAAADVLLPEQLRSLMRLLPHSVVVLTSSDPSATDGPSPRAMTMSSLTSLTLQPVPLVTFNVATPSRTLSALEGARHFNIHILRDSVAGARVADWFSRGNAEGHRVFEGLEKDDAQSQAGGPGCMAELLHGEPPLLKGDGVLYVMRCRLLDDAPLGGLVQVRDHVIVVAEVVEIIEGRHVDAAAGTREDDFGLVYADRRYRRLGESMVKA
ncbi:flavin reductase like domain-containing protein [Plectosphaerella cucumerina]|uniref:Flavin reductase like domain-containing protein n=1 Tax=Plectosphaerella cucumerina TaxID=40658 RepID=A0A8K0TJX3_9PEZI|nr:flavin reductase like domain-containing protein [Plectosphaerella cucumerina]